MSFYSLSIIFDGVSSESFGLIAADVDGGRQESGRFARSSIQEDRIAARHDGLDYGIVSNEPLSFPVSLVVSDGARRLDRYELAAISGWLTGHQDYRRLVICQPDLQDVYYKCRITELNIIEVGLCPIGVSATVVCDAPYAYRSGSPSVISCTGTADVLYRNLSNVNDYYKPVIEIASSGTAVSIQNRTDGSLFKLEGMGAGTRTITVDCKNQLLSSDDGTDLYALWNQDCEKRFPRFVRGDNQLSVTGECTITIENEFPWNVGY